jgi:hypothetical protein
MTWVDRGISLALLAACALLWPLAGRFPGSAAAFPQVVLAAVAVLAGLMLLRTLFPALAIRHEGEGSPRPQALTLPLIVAAALGLAIFSMRLVGFFPAMAGLVVVLHLVLGVRQRGVFFAACLAALVFVYLVFELLLGVPLTETRLFG